MLNHGLYRTSATEANLVPIAVDENGVLLGLGGGGTVTANAGTDLNTSALALENGGNLDQLAAWLATQKGFQANTVITRAANVTPYVANSIWAPVFQLSQVGIANRQAIITGCQVFFSNTTVPAGMAGFRLYLYSSPPPSAIPEGGTFSISAADRAVCLTPGGLILGSATQALGGGTVFLDTFVSTPGAINQQIKIPVTESVFAYLVNIAAHTPVSGTTATVRLYTIGV